jgi:imidazoleglycerol-phosphate dehydratase
MVRTAKVTRKTSETEITIELNLDGSGENKIDTSVKFMDHMLRILAKHSRCNLEVKAIGDLTHHLVEDVGIALGECFQKALGNKKGINRYGSALIPMDETLARA